MALLNYLFLLSILALPADVDGRDLSLRVEEAAAPAHPVHTMASGLVVTEIVINRMTGGVQTRPLHGEPPFLSSALDALMRWRFSIPPGVARSRTSITFLFRPPAMYSVRMRETVIRPWLPGDDSAALPQKVIDPGYPAASRAAGVAILEVRVDATGRVAGIQTLDGIVELADQAKGAVHHWIFSPAIISGRAVPSTTYVVISFIPPL